MATSRQPEAFEIIAGSSMARRTWRTMVGAPQPGHERRPLEIISSLCVSDFRVRGVPRNVITYLLEYSRGVTLDQVEGKLNTEKIKIVLLCTLCENH
jgi:hypothetical protein